MTHLQSSQNLQNLISFGIFLKCLHSISVSSLIVFTGLSPDDYLSLAITSSYTLYNTAIYSALVLISKGYCITRTQLRRGEKTMIGLIVGALYLSFSAFIIGKAGLRVFQIAVLLVLFCMIVKFCNSTIQGLSQESTGHRATTQKLHLMSSFLVTMYIYFSEQLLCL